MKINHYNISHKGHLPIRVLQHNIISQFEKTTSDFLKLSICTINEKGLKPEIAYFVNCNSLNGDKLKGPFVFNESKEINIHETFMSYLWCITYSLFIYTDLLIEGKEESICEKRILAENTFQYALSLIDGYHDWDKEKLPNPELYPSEWAADIEKTNELFLYGFNFILCHEFAHVELGHCHAAVSHFLSLDEKKEFELRADERAIDLLDNGIFPNNQCAVTYGVTIALASLLFLRSTVANKIHPDSDVRISNALDRFSLEENDTAWVISCAAIGLWSQKYSIPVDWKNRNSFKELYTQLSRQLE